MTYRDDDEARRAFLAERRATVAGRLASLESWERDLARMDASLPERPKAIAALTSQAVAGGQDDEAELSAIERVIVEHLAAVRERPPRRGLNFLTPLFDYAGRHSAGCLYVVAYMLIPLVVLIFAARRC